VSEWVSKGVSECVGGWGWIDGFVSEWVSEWGASFGWLIDDPLCYLTLVVFAKHSDKRVLNGSECDIGWDYVWNYDIYSLKWFF